jgi:hypothetical protein
MANLLPGSLIGIIIYQEKNDYMPPTPRIYGYNLLSIRISSGFGPENGGIWVNGVSRYENDVFENV